MLTFTPAAQAKVRELLATKGQHGFAVRVRVIGRDTDSFRYEFRSVEEAARQPDDQVLEQPGFKVLVDPESSPLLAGSTIDFGGLDAGGFKIDNPNPVWTDDVARAVAHVVAERINPAVAAHGGSVVLVNVEGGTAYIRMQGGCQGCGLAGVTLRSGIEKEIREAVPQIAAIVDLTQHDQGDNPYYLPGQMGSSPLAVRR
jgi:Fe/S biogenesis protein NfuA